MKNYESAFPIQSVYIEDQDTNSRGMTLRDYFAARAMQSLTQHFLTEELHLTDNDWMSGVAMDAYTMADAMLKEREAK